MQNIFSHAMQQYLLVSSRCSLRWDANAHACEGTHASKVMCAIYHMCKIKVFSFFVFLLYTSHREKLFIEGFFIEDYIQEI